MQKLEQRLKNMWHTESNSIVLTSDTRRATHAYIIAGALAHETHSQRTNWKYMNRGSNTSRSDEK